METTERCAGCGSLETIGTAWDRGEVIAVCGPCSGYFRDVFEVPPVIYEYAPWRYAPSPDR